MTVIWIILSKHHSCSCLTRSNSGLSWGTCTWNTWTDGSDAHHIHGPSWRILQTNVPTLGPSCHHEVKRGFCLFFFKTVAMLFQFKSGAPKSLGNCSALYFRISDRFRSFLLTLLASLGAASTGLHCVVGVRSAVHRSTQFQTSHSVFNNRFCIYWPIPRIQDHGSNWGSKILIK